MKIREEQHKNGDSITKVDIYQCDWCGKEINEMWPRLEKKNDKHICLDCPFNMIKEILDCESIKWPYLFWIKEIEKLYFSNLRRRRKMIDLVLRKEILRKYKFICQTCGSERDLSIDHIKPVCLGGTDNPNNLTVLCRSCNSKKGKKYGGK
jgi:DNA-directed RNA polymerase subunit RPC12/RpoP